VHLPMGTAARPGGSSRCPQNGWTDDGDTATCTIGDLGPGASASLVLDVTVPDSVIGPQYSVLATVPPGFDTRGDLNSADNSAKITAKEPG